MLRKLIIGLRFGSRAYSDRGYTRPGRHPVLYEVPEP